MNVLIINGPNLNLLGERQPTIYGTETLDEITAWIRDHPKAAGHSLKFEQSNHEGVIIDIIQTNRIWADGIIINPAAFTHYSYAIRDVLEAVDKPVVEVHLSDIKHRENFRKTSVIEPVCLKQIAGKGKQGYLDGLMILISNSN
ncbi:type II 3-dehydroquinate dehydratase [Candidatus Neomarinimicrobiota bacterium]